MRCLVISVRPAHQPVLAWLAKAGHQREQALRGRSSRRGSRANANERRASNYTNTRWLAVARHGRRSHCDHLCQCCLFALTRANVKRKKGQDKT